MSPNLTARPHLEGKLKIAAWVVTGVVLLLVGLMRRVKIPLPDDVDVGFLPAVNASINSLTALLLVVALVFVKQKKLTAHRNAIYACLALSVVFLLCYVGYHFTTPEVLFGDQNGDGVVDATELAAVGGMRTAYLVILFSHIGLAGVLLPFILLTSLRAFVGKYEAHKKLARFVWPMWLYVAVTGPVVYVMLRPYY